MALYVHKASERTRPPITLSNGKERAVFHQMLPDFPGSSIEWVKRTDWTGPKPIPLDLIDTEHRATWVASREPEKVKLHMRLIQEGESAPIILAKLHGHDKLVIIDAHHRFLAYEALGREPIAYVGDVKPGDTEAALTAHSHQYSGGSKLNVI